LRLNQGRKRRTADGFESFCVSQYFPNNIQLLVGSDSQHVYQIDYATIRLVDRVAALADAASGGAGLSACVRGGLEEGGEDKGRRSESKESSTKCNKVRGTS